MPQNENNDFEKLLLDYNFSQTSILKYLRTCPVS